MKSVSKFLSTNPKKHSWRTKSIIFSLFFFPVIAIFGWFAVHTFVRGSQNLENLTHVSGVISGDRIMKHKRVGKYKTFYEDVLVLSIQGCEDELGFMNDNKYYSDLTNLVGQNKQLTADVYYDKSRQRIEQNVTLHTFDLKINKQPYIMIEDITKIEMTASIIFSAITILLAWLTYVGAKRIKLKGVID